MSRIGKSHTSVYYDKGATCVRYHETEVVRLNWPHVTLNTGGWRTVTTKARMNQAASEWNLDFRVFQEDFSWFVRTPFEIFPFDDNIISFSLKA